MPRGLSLLIAWQVCKKFSSLEIQTISKNEKSQCSKRQRFMSVFNFPDRRESNLKFLVFKLNLSRTTVNMSRNTQTPIMIRPQSTNMSSNTKRRPGCKQVKILKRWPWYFVVCPCRKNDRHHLKLKGSFCLELTCVCVIARARSHIHAREKLTSV